MPSSREPHALTAQKFTELYEEYLDAVFNYCLFRVGDRQLAEDVTAETFEQAWRDRHSYDPQRAGVTTWLFTIARHRVVDKQRKKGRRSFLSLNHRHKDEEPLPEEQLANRQRLAQLRALVQALPAKQQELIALKFGAGLTNRRIAKLLGRSESAVGSALYRLMEKLRSQWAESRKESQHE